MAAVAALVFNIHGCKRPREASAPAHRNDESGTPPTRANARRPSVLFAAPTGAAYLDLDYLRELHAEGFEVDYTENLGQVTRDRLQSYNAVVLFVTPNAYDLNRPATPEQAHSFTEPIADYLAIGGGVLLMPAEMNVVRQQLSEIAEPLGARLPAEQIVENSGDKIARMAHSDQGLRLAFTDQIAPLPLTEGVHSIWYPYERTRWGAMTLPLVVNDKWQVVVRASSTAVTKAIDLHAAVDAVPNLLNGTEPEAAPPIMAVRQVGLGRVALIAEWAQFSVGAGTKWIYDREVLDRGLANRKSDFGRLLSNTFRWLAEPSLSREAPGGFSMATGRLEAPNAAETVKVLYRAKPIVYDPDSLSAVTVPAGRKVFHGIIGARTALSSGRGDVAAYARAARRAHLDFLVFLEDFEHMNREKLARLTADCARNSDADLLLLPGFSIVSNLGNHLFFFGPDPAWPPDAVLTGDRKNILYVQEQSDNGKYTGYKTPFMDWVASTYHPDKGQVGFYDFVDSPRGLRLPDARLYAMVGLRYYRNGVLVEDLLDSYLTTVASTIAPTPVSVNEVDSPDDLAREVASGHSTTFAEAASLDANKRDALFYAALRWTSQYDAMPVFISSGPRILSWPSCHRVGTYGAEQFVPERAVMDAPLSVQSSAGLSEVLIYDGPRLFRRFLPRGVHAFEQHFILDAEVQRNLVVVAHDQRGGTAVSFPLRSWSDDSLAPVFCSDHINDCESVPILAHGPFSFPLSRPPLLPVDVAGRTWDGGQPPAISSIGTQETLAYLNADEGATSALRLDPVSLLEFSDTGAVGVEAQRLEVYDDRLLQVVNPWNTGGPIAGAARWFDNVQRYRQWISPTSGPPEAGWAARGVRAGASPSLFTSKLRFRRAVHIRSLALAHLGLVPHVVILVGDSAGHTILEPSARSPREVTLAPGSWFAVYGPGPMNAHIFWNRGDTLRLAVSSTLDILADLSGAQLGPRDEYTFELSGLAFPLDPPIETEARIRRYVDFLREPTALQVLRGTRRRSPGLLEVAVDGGSTELAIPRAEGVDGLTLPVRLTGLNPRWSVGVLQKDGYSPGFYGSGHDRYRALGVDADGDAYLPLYVDRAPRTWVEAGHPIIADSGGDGLFIQVTCLGGTPPRWHVSVNNPGDREVATVLQQAMVLPGLEFARRPVAVPAGGYVVLQ